MTAPSATAPGTLYLVATPIGNLDDITLRALDILKSVDAILAEDTRHTSTLLHSLGIKKALFSLHAHNEAIKSESVIQRLREGQSLALVSDAGTPLINDPGFPLVQLARTHGLSVIPIPGPCALITALSAAGIPCDLFTFAGFLPAKSSARQQRLAELQAFGNHTLVLYESPHRIAACIEDIEKVFGETTELVLAKELTKAHERFVTGTGREILAWLRSSPKHSKGEFVVMIPPRALAKKMGDVEKILDILLSDLPLKQAVKLAAQITGEHKNYLYKMALQK